MNINTTSIKSVIRENYLILIGIIAFFLIIAYSSSNSNKPEESKAENTTESAVEESASKNQYIVQKGDDLWKIAEKVYGSGYNAVDIAKENKLENPGTIFKDQVLKLPSVAPKQPTKGEIMATNTEMAPNPTPAAIKEGEKYVIKRGDTLWSISEKYYGTGYDWVKLAKANNLTHPNLIHADNALVIPAK